MTARRAPAAHLCLRVGSRYEVAFVPFPRRPPMFVIGTGSALVSFTLPDQLEAAHVDFARRLAAQAWAYAVAVERRYRGLPPLPDGRVPYMLTAKAEALLDAGPAAGGPGAAARRPGGDGMTATSASVRFGADGVAHVESFIRLTGHTFIQCCIYDDIAPILAIDDGHVKVSITVPAGDQVTEDDVTVGRLLAEAVSRYAAELERRVSPGREGTAAAGDGAGQAG